MTSVFSSIRNLFCRKRKPGQTLSRGGRPTLAALSKKSTLKMWSGAAGVGPEHFASGFLLSWEILAFSNRQTAIKLCTPYTGGQTH